ncbi:hypothetical protein [Frigidibacter sp.]|nr:hypothetical protein [Frigidibacter sp.]MDP3339766.1 hypothetical protein [Frigidibacter sp.]
MKGRVVAKAMAFASDMGDDHKFQSLRPPSHPGLATSPLAV